MTYFRQCLLSKIVQQGNATYELRQTAWLPEQFVTLGGAVRIRSRGTEWDDDWRIAWCGERIAENLIHEHRLESGSHAACTAD
jgi:hypothetical protein